jgi:hypothetical protein
MKKEVQYGTITPLEKTATFNICHVNVQKQITWRILKVPSLLNLNTGRTRSATATRGMKHSKTPTQATLQNFIAALWEVIEYDYFWCCEDQVLENENTAVSEHSCTLDTITHHSSQIGLL